MYTENVAASVVITTYEDDHRLRHTLDGFLRQKRAEHAWELIIVNDGGSFATEGLVQAAARAADLPSTGLIGVQYHYLQPQTSDFRLAAARNLGLKHAQGDRVVICDCDTVPEDAFMWKHTLEERPDDVLIGLRRRVAQEAVEGLTESPVDESWLASQVWREDERTYQGAFMLAYRDLPHGDPTIVCWGCNFSAPTEAMREIGGFDEDFVGWGGEDEDMARRLRARGYQFHPTSAVVYHLDHPQRTSQKASGLLQEKRDAGIFRNGGRIYKNPPIYL